MGNLGRQAHVLESAYSRLGKAVRLRPRLLEQEVDFPVVLPPPIVDEKTESCVTVTVLAAPNISFLLTFPQQEDDIRRRTWPIPSAAGAAEVTRCGARKSLLRGLFIKLRSRRGVFEFIVVESENPPPSVSDLLKPRNPGASLPAPQVGRRPHLAPLRLRLEVLRRKLRARGAASIDETNLSSDATGAGSSILNLEAGCHRFDLLTESYPEAPPDLDGRLFTLARGTEVASDDEQRSHVELVHCLGRPERLRLDYSGALPQSDVRMVHSVYPIPDAIPVGWGAIARAGLAKAAYGDGLSQLSTPPIAASLGVRGATRFVVPVDPGQCYVALVAPIRGDTKSLALAIRSGGRTSESHAQDGAGVSVAFCAHGGEAAHLETQALGTSVAWILGVFEVGRLSP